MSRYHLWVMPSGDAYDVLARTIVTLSEQYRSPRFPPHVTVLGHLPGSQSDILANARLLSNRLSPYDIQLTVPSILMALMVNGVARTMLPRESMAQLAIWVLIFSIGISDWPQYARIARGTTMVEKSKDYVAAARLIGVHPGVIMVRHILPNAMGPVLVIATIGLALAIITEATLSFLGVGVPPTTPSLGTLIRIGNDFLLSGEWWITLFPALALVTLVLSVNLLGDWLRDAINPKLR
jgi:peptide/nickel transport system permease protein